MDYDLKVLEFDKIIDQIKSHAHTLLGKQALEKLVPSNDENTVAAQLNETDDALKFIVEGLEPRFGGIYDITPSLKRASINGVLTEDAFVEIASHIEATKRIQKDMNRLESFIDKRLDLCDYADKLIILDDLLKAIKNIIDDQGDVRDNASPTLKTIRQGIAATERQVNKALESVLKKDADHLADAIVTMRYNRYVVPVKLSNKNKIKGTIVDYSSSGETAYVEPEVLRSLSQKLEQLSLKEKREIEKLLAELTQEVKVNKASLEANLAVLTHLDMLFAKARYAHKTQSTKPKISSKLVFFNARHPLISDDEVVANTISFDEGVKTIIITGSNTGGKTVTLKTVGLLTLMAQSGCLIPVSQNSEIKVFNQVKADIGDEQSIEQSLSTFSSHLTNIVNIIRNLKQNSLLLFDELGSGTDPNEGSTLGMGILNHLQAEDVLIMATTHYPELKAYAYTEFSIMNASVEFDEVTLKPTYRLLLRTPGESHALLIAERLGLPKSIIDQAKERVLTSKTEVSELIDNLKNESKRLDKMITEYEQTTKDLALEKKDIAELKRRLQQDRDKLKDKLTLENQATISALKEKAETLISDLETLKTKSYKEHELATLKHQTKQLVVNAEHTSSTTHHTYSVGDQVYIMKFNRYGELIEQQKNKQWVVQMGSLTSVFKEKEFEYAGKKEKEKKPQSNTGKTVKKTVPSELDLRGLRVHEAQDELNKYLDDCTLANIPFVSIIHGFGTLALRKMVHEVLSAHNAVKSYRDGKGNEGGQGVSIVYFE